MTTRRTLVCCLLLAPLMVQAQEAEEKKTLPQLTIEALAEETGGRGQLEMSSTVTRNGASMMCATTEAYSASGNFIGLTYWQVVFTKDNADVKSLVDVTGLNHECYGSDLKRYQN